MGDADLDNEFLLASPTVDTTFLEFDFELAPGNTDLFFNFVFYFLKSFPCLPPNIYYPTSPN